MGKAIRKKKAPPYNPGAFLDLPTEVSSYERARVVVLPMPLEESVSYGGGAAGGPGAILEASAQVELYDHLLDCEPAMGYGVHTLPVPGFFGGGAGVGEVLDGIAEEVRLHLSAGKFVLGLGGEHTASLGVARGVAMARGDFVLVHIDAHADLRDEYLGDPLSHACVVRRICELPQCRGVLQLGIRSTSVEQVEFVRGHGVGGRVRPFVRSWYAEEMHSGKGWRREFGKAVKGRRVFFTFDVDGLDPSIVPATGTPEPNGLSWRQLMRIGGIVAENAESCVAMDCVELAPAAGLHYADFTVARALYRLMSMFLGK